MRSPEAKHKCPLFKRDVYWGDCWIVQDIRRDDTDMEFALEEFDLATANKLCEQCRWCYVDEWDD